MSFACQAQAETLCHSRDDWLILICVIHCEAFSEEKKNFEMSHETEKKWLFLKLLRERQQKMKKLDSSSKIFAFCWIETNFHSSGNHKSCLQHQGIRDAKNTQRMWCALFSRPVPCRHTHRNLNSTIIWVRFERFLKTCEWLTWIKLKR